MSVTDWHGRSSWVSPMGKQKRLTEEDKAKAFILRGEGYTHAKIAVMLGFKVGAINKLLRGTGNFGNRTPSLYARALS